MQTALAGETSPSLGDVDKGNSLEREAKYRLSEKKKCDGGVFFHKSVRLLQLYKEYQNIQF